MKRKSIWTTPIGPTVRWMLPLYRRYLPELRRFRTTREQIEAIRAASREMQWKPRVVLMGSVLGGAIGCGMMFVSDIVIRTVGAPIGIPFIWLLVVCIAFFVVTPLMLILLKHPLRRSLRSQLIRQGVAICLECGYDLRGQTVARCPECGTPSESVKGDASESANEKSERSTP